MNSNRIDNMLTNIELIGDDVTYHTWLNAVKLLKSNGCKARLVIDHSRQEYRIETNASEALVDKILSSANIAFVILISDDEGTILEYGEPEYYRFLCTGEYPLW